jgi:hypothetical protein
MSRRTCGALTGLAIVALVAGTLTAPSGASTRRQAAPGVDKGSIQIVDIVPDIDALIARGLPLSGQSTQGFLERFLAPVEAYGPIRGRDVEVTKVAWDPQDITSFDTACTQAAIDNNPFVVVNGSGFRDSAVPCVTVDNDTPFMSGDMMQLSLHKASKKNLVTLSLPPEVAGREAVRLLDRTKTLPKSAKIAILSNNVPGPKAAGDAIEKELEKRGFDVVSKVEANGLAADASLLRREIAAAAPTFEAEGADTVFTVQSFTQGGAFFDEAGRSNYTPQMYAVDGQANTCTKDGIGRIPAAAAGVICVTAYDYLSEVDGAGVRSDNALEAKCRAMHEDIKGFETTPNMPGGGLTVGGVKYNEDFSQWECMIAELLLPAIKKAGKNPTWPKVYDNIMSVEKGPAAYMSNGEGGFGPNKPYYANQIHMAKVAIVTPDTPQAANGTYNGCPSPVSCLVPMTVDGKEWFPISASGKS